MWSTRGTTYLRGRGTQYAPHRNLLDTHPREGALREGPRGGFRSLIIAGRRRRADGGKGRVTGRLQGGKGNGAHYKERVPQCRMREVSGHKRAKSTPGRPKDQHLRGSMSGGMCINFMEFQIMIKLRRYLDYLQEHTMWNLLVQLS